MADATVQLEAWTGVRSEVAGTLDKRELVNVGGGVLELLRDFPGGVGSSGPVPAGFRLDLVDEHFAAIRSTRVYACKVCDPAGGLATLHAFAAEVT